MKKLLMLLLVLALLSILLVAAVPVSAGMGDSGAVGGDPPGWSHQNPGGGGTENPGSGPGAGGP